MAAEQNTAAIAEGFIIDAKTTKFRNIPKIHISYRFQAKNGATVEGRWRRLSNRPAFVQQFKDFRAATPQSWTVLYDPANPSRNTLYPCTIAICLAGQA